MTDPKEAPPEEAPEVDPTKEVPARENRSGGTGRPPPPPPPPREP